ncbi:MAG: ComF family protein [Dehalococcoidia bacterium]|nr:ComF family protein [Dehalococcoidia bacterium]
MSAPLGGLLAEFLKSGPAYYEIIVPVPLHPRRMRQRGYNQAALLAREAAKATGLPVMEDLLRRVKDTAAQARSASAAERRRNVRNAFECPRQLDGDSILLIDDVCTTGATLDSCASALKKAGAGPVWGLTIARETI